MGAVSSVDIGRRRVNIYRFTGQVLDSQRSSETSVTSYNNGQVSAQTFHYNEIFLRSADGEERAVEVASAKVPIRVGNTVTVLWGIVGNRDKGSYCTVHKHDTRQTGHIAKAINDASGPPLYNMLIILFVFIGVFSVMGAAGGSGGAIVLVLATAGFFYWLLGRRKKLRNAMEAALAS
jgi:hypothetical protein